MKTKLLLGSAGLVFLAAILGVLGNFAGAFSVGLASIGLFFISTQFKELS